MSTPRHLIVAGTMIHALAACQHDDSVSIALANDDDDAIRCVAVLAHFVTVDLPAIPAGGSYRFTLVDTPDGGLALAHRDMGAMMLENLLCGTDGNWSRSVTNIDLAAACGHDRTFRCSTQRERLACQDNSRRTTSAPCRHLPSAPDR